MKHYKFFLLAAAIIILDQIVKLWVHHSMAYGITGQIRVFGDWFKLYYTLNPGMAFGITLGESYGKFLLSALRIVAVVAISVYLLQMARKHANQGFLWCIALILGGAVGNLIDSTFYGVWLDNAPEGVATPWLHGQVIDMFYFDIWEGMVPDFMPSWWPAFLPRFGAGQYMSFWPIFNIADASIFVGVCLILIFQKRFFAENPTQNMVSGQ